MSKNRDRDLCLENVEIDLLIFSSEDRSGFFLSGSSNLYIFKDTENMTDNNPLTS